MTFFIKRWYDYCVDKMMAWLWRKSDISQIDLSSLTAQEHFIPIRYEIMRDMILERSSLTPQEKEELHELGVMFEEHYHHDYHRKFLDLKDAFAPFDPDRETIYEPDYTDEQKAQKRQLLIDGITEFLNVSNYCQLSEDNFNDCLKLQPFGGLSVKIDTEKFKHFRVFCRGIQKIDVIDKFLWIFKRRRQTINFCRIFVLAEYKTNPTEEEITEAKKHREKLRRIPEEQAGTIIAKQFRDVPVENLKIVAPEIVLRLPLFDKITIGGNFITGFIISLIKSVPALLKAAVFTTFSFVIIIVGLGALICKSVFGFFHSRNKCMKQFSESLYHKSLSNNVAAVSQLFNQAEAQEVKEAFLAYYMLYIHRDEKPTMEQLDKYVEAELESAFGKYIDFEVDDALRKLLEKELATVILGENGEPDRYQLLLPIKAALKQLDFIWDNIHTVE